MDQPTKTGGLSRGLLIAASVVQALTFAAHTVVHLKGPDEPGDDAHRRLMELMQTVPIDLPGARRTTLELSNGFGWHFSLSLLALGVIGLVVGWGDVGARRRFAGAAAVALAVLTVNSVVHFFAIPTAFMGLAAVLYAGAFFTAGRGANGQ